METSILKTIRSMLDMDPDDEVYNTDLMVHINSSIMVLCQIGIGPKDGFRISGIAETWNELLGDSKMLESAKEYIYLRTKIGFDPPATSFVMEAMKTMTSELEVRLNMQIDPGEEDTPNV